VLGVGFIGVVCGDQGCGVGGGVWMDGWMGNRLIRY